MTAILNVDVKLKIRFRQSMRVYVKNIPAKFHADPIKQRNGRNLRLFEQVAQQQQEQQQQDE